MFKKLALALGCLIFLLATPVFAEQVTDGGGPGDSCICCIRDLCKVDNPTKIEVGYDLRIDIDVCVDAGNLMPRDFWSAQAVIYQSGSGNKAGIIQNDKSQIAGIIQEGNNDVAGIAQCGNNDYALILQYGGNNNKAGIIQSMSDATGIIVQTGSQNRAIISQGGGWISLF